MKLFRKIAVLFLSAAASICAASGGYGVAEPAAANGWEFVRSQNGKIVYIPFEGYYASKGGRVQSPEIPLEKVAGQAYYRLSFAAKAEKAGYWWVDLFDGKGNPLPDVNSALYVSDDWIKYDVVVPVAAAAASARLAFVVEAGTSVRDIRFEPIPVGEAASWCDGFYATLPRLSPADLAKATAGAFAKLPRTRRTLREGGSLHVLYLGDSIVNDTYCGNVTALIQRDFPGVRFEFTVSVRGSTGCWYYHRKENFEEYVARHRPDLVLIGGISNRMHEDSQGPAADCMERTIRRCREIGAEVAVLTPPPSYEFRVSPADADWHFGMKVPSNRAGNCLDIAFALEAVGRTDCAFWDVTTPPANAIRDSRKPLDWFKRDAAHNNDRGKQLIARTLAAFFRSALSEDEQSRPTMNQGGKR